MNVPARTLELGRVGESVKRVDAIPKVKGEFASSSCGGLVIDRSRRVPVPDPRTRPE
jgi:hypothetical protein